MDDLVGRHVSELDTPMPVIDLDAMERNIARLATHARQRGIRQWPHTKTHKNPEIARMQLDAGAGGLTVAKPGEAEVMASHGLGPLLLHYPSFGAEKWRRIAGVAATTDLTVALDSAEVAEPLARELAARGVTAQALVELDVGMRRTGVESPAAALALAQTIDGSTGWSWPASRATPATPGARSRRCAPRSPRWRPRCRRRSGCSATRGCAATGCPPDRRPR